MGLDSFKLEVYLDLQGWQLAEKKTVAMSMLFFTMYSETIYIINIFITGTYNTILAFAGCQILICLPQIIL